MIKVYSVPALNNAEHSRVKATMLQAKHGDNIPMDLSENPFFVKDAVYETPCPDEMNFSDKRIEQFLRIF